MPAEWECEKEGLVETERKVDGNKNQQIVIDPYIHTGTSTLIEHIHIVNVMKGIKGCMHVCVYTYIRI